MIAVIDYGLGNLGSIANMLKRIGVRSVITSDHGLIESADQLILPGVGAFDAGMANLRARGLIDLLEDAVMSRVKPILGICLGMQLMMEGSAEGREPGLGWIKGRAHRFEFSHGEALKVPHMGWNSVHALRHSRLLTSQPKASRFYFVHSYYVRCDRQEDVLLRAKYGVEFDAGFERDNVMGVQFHPEKSHQFGMSLLHDFARLRC